MMRRILRAGVTLAVLAAAFGAAGPAKAVLSIAVPAVTGTADGLGADRVTGLEDGDGLVTDDQPDGTYTIDVTNQGPHQITRIRVVGGPGEWNTIPEDGLWVAGVTGSASPGFLNDSQSGAVAIAFTDSIGLRLYLATSSGGTGYWVEVCFDGSTEQCVSTTITTSSTAPVDSDGDGSDDDADCDDVDPAINPEATEIPDNNVDENCDSIYAHTFYADSDADTYGNSGVSVVAGAAPDGYVANDDDCNDTNGAANPGGTEIPDNNVDENCDGIYAHTYYADSDADTFGDSAVSVVAGAAPEGHVANDDDCDDTNADVNPDADEIPNNGVDDDCDSSTADATTLSDISYSNGSYTNKGSRTTISTFVVADAGCVAGRVVTFTVNGQNYQATSLESGKASVQVTLLVGSYPVSLSTPAAGGCAAGENSDAGTVVVAASKPKGRK